MNDHLSVGSLTLMQSWPLWDQPKHFELGLVLNSVITDGLPPSQIGAIGAHHAGCWECNLADDSLIWSGGVYDIFGLPRGAKLSRAEAVSLYSDESREVMESLRAHAISHRRGFTVDVQILPATAEPRWMRLIAAPIIEGGRVVKLHGFKLAI